MRAKVRVMHQTIVGMPIGLTKDMKASIKSVDEKLLDLESKVRVFMKAKQ
jgi:hypothetical protein